MLAASQALAGSPAGNGATANASSGLGETRKAKSPAQEYLTNCRSLYSCIYCRTHLANHDELVSRSFQGNHGRAYLFNSVVNVDCGPAVQRELNTGSHAVADIYCANCHTTLGWKYEKAYVDTQKYKEGKYIIELAHVVRENRHLEFDRGEEMFFRNSAAGSGSSSSSRAGSKRSQVNLNNNIYNHLRFTSSSVMRSVSHQDNHRSSLTPLAGSNGHSQWHNNHNNKEVTTTATRTGSANYDYALPAGAAAAAANEDDDEDLMFPFYDDMMMCASRSSYPNNLSYSHHNRMRRSLYLESTPYDWKYATAAAASDNVEASTTTTTCRPEFNQPAASAPKLTSATAVAAVTAAAVKLDCRSGSSSLADSGLSSDLSSPSASSSSSSSSSASDDALPAQASSRQKSYQHNNNIDNKYISKKGRRRDPSERSGDEEELDGAHTDNDDTQFKFEADAPADSVNDDNDTLACREDIKHCDQLDTLGCDGDDDDVDTTTSATKSGGSCNASEIEQARSRDQIPTLSSSHLNSLDNDDEDSDSVGANTISIEDEEFYDCYTDHEVSTPMVESRSST